MLKRGVDEECLQLLLLLAVVELLLRRSKDCFLLLPLLLLLLRGLSLAMRSKRRSMLTKVLDAPTHSTHSSHEPTAAGRLEDAD